MNTGIPFSVCNRIKGIFYFPVLLVLLCLIAAAEFVSAKESHVGSSIPVFPGATIIKESMHERSARLEMETQQAPEAVAAFYRNTRDKNIRIQNLSD